MELSIKTHGLDISDPLKAYTERRLRFSLGGFAAQLEGVEVRLADVNGPGGGIDKRCAIKVIHNAATPDDIDPELPDES